MAWLQFFYLSAVWGSAFFWIKVALDEIGPFTLVAMRLVYASAGLLLLMKWRGHKLPRDPKLIGHLFVMSLMSPTIPLMLVSIAETQIDSVVASVLNATVPLFTIVFAHFFLADERMTRSRFGGLVMGFLGVLVLMSRDISFNNVLSGSFMGYVAMIASTFLYGFSAIYSRLFIKNLPPLVHAAGIILWGMVVAVIALLIMEWPLKLPTLSITWTATLWLGFLSTCSGFAVYFSLLKKWDATRSSLVNYVAPVVGVGLGLVFRGEALEWRLLTGAGLIMSGIAVVNHRAIRKLIARGR